MARKKKEPEFIEIKGPCYAKPRLNNDYGMKEFPSGKAAAKYLEELTGYNMPVIDWQMIGKIVEKENANA